MKSPVSNPALVTPQCVITACVSSHFSTLKSGVVAWPVSPCSLISDGANSARPRLLGAAPALLPSRAHQMPGAGCFCVFGVVWSLSVVLLLWQMSFGCCQWGPALVFAARIRPRRHGGAVSRVSAPGVFGAEIFQRQRQNPSFTLRMCSCCASFCSSSL